MLSTVRQCFTFFTLGFLIGFASCSSVPFDTSVSAAEGNDPTVVLFGCNQQPSSGYLFCRVRETANPTEVVTLTVPKVDCKRDSCVRWQLTRLDGSFGESGSIAKGKVQAEFQLSKIVGSDLPISKNADGEYQVLVRIYFQGSDGEEHESIQKGFIRINVLGENYSQVGCNDPVIAWEVALNEFKECKLQWTSKLRGAVCGRCLNPS